MMTLVRLTAYLCTYLAYSSPTFAQCPSPRYAWTRTYRHDRGSLPTYPRVLTIVEDGVLFGGAFGGTVDFNPNDDGVDLRTSNGDVDGFITKLRPDGAYAWTYTVGGTGLASISGAVTDTFGGIFAAGGYTGTIEFDPGPGVDQRIADLDGSTFLIMMHSDGTYGWTRTFWQHAGISGMVLIGKEDIAIVGVFAGTLDFDPGPGVDEHSSVVGEIFVAKLGLDGSYGWTRNFGGPGYDAGTGIAADPEGNIVVTGTFRGAVDFDPGPGLDVHRQVGRFEDIFVTKFYADGAYAWTRTSPADYYGDIGQVAVDEAGNAYFSGEFTTTLDFDPTDGVDIRVPTPSPPPLTSPHDIFVTQLHADGSYGWTYTVGGDHVDYGRAVATTADGVFVVGEFSHTVDFDPGPAIDEHTAAGGNNDPFLVELARDGSFRWARTWGDAGPAHPLAVAVDPRGDIIVPGVFGALVDGRTDLDPNCSADNLPVTGAQLVTFVTKFVCADAGDFDLDGDVDLRDMARFQRCFTGPGAPRCSPRCDAFDIASADPASSGVDNAIDLADFDALSPLLTGPQ